MLAEPHPVEPPSRPPTDPDRDQVYRITDAAHAEAAAAPALRAISAVIAEIMPAADDTDAEPAADQSPTDRALRNVTRMATARQRGDFGRAVG